MSKHVAEPAESWARSAGAMLLCSAAVSLAVCALASASPSGRIREGEAVAQTSRSSVAMLCFDHDDYAKRVAPRSCAVLGRHAGRDCDCDGDNLVNITWSGWGDAIATGKGIEKTLHPGQPGTTPFRVRLKVRRLRKDRCGWIYTRLRESSPMFGTHTLVLAVCPRPVS